MVNALLGRARQARGCSTPGDDRLETRAYAVKRYVFRLGHAQRSGRFATSIGQLVAGLAPVMGWGQVPRDRAERARFVRAHRRSVQRWLDDLQAAGLVAHEPEQDSDGLWWRTQIVLLAAPAATRLELEVATRRARGWRSRERARRRRGRVAPGLGGIRARSSAPSRERRARIARERNIGLRERRRRAAVEAQIADATARRSGCRDLTHPFGAPPTSALSPVSPERPRRSETSGTEGPIAGWPARAVSENATVAAETGARGRAPISFALEAPAALTASTEEGELVSREPFDALVARRVAARAQALAARNELLVPQVTARLVEVTGWPRGRRCSLGRLREAWTARRYGLAIVVDSGAAAAGPVRPGDVALAARAIELYEAFAAQRPPGWPDNGPGALCALASMRGADRFAGDLARLLGLAKAMRAAALEHDPARLARARARAAARTAPLSARWAFWRLDRPRVESAEARRQRVRDAVLFAGRNPAAWPNAALALEHLPIEPGADQVRLLDDDRCEELDGIGARATRYRAELARGRWQLPDHQTSPAARHPDPEEGSPQ